jgi:hypothetical protein
VNHPGPEILISIVLMAVTILIGAAVVLRPKQPPVGQALIIATVSNLLGWLFVSVLHWPGAVSYTLPTVAFFILSHLFFRPSIPRFLGYWLVGFAAYLVIHMLISSLFGWTFMFPFWKLRLS